jgi:DNA primase
MELGRLLTECPEIALLEGESLAGLDLKDPSLDRLRHELLNLAASGSSLEKAGVQTHFARLGLTDFVGRLAPRNPNPDGDRQEADTPEDDPEVRFLRAAQTLREMADGTSDYHRLLGARKAGHDGDLRR